MTFWRNPYFWRGYARGTALGYGIGTIACLIAWFITQKTTALVGVPLCAGSSAVSWWMLRHWSDLP